MGNQLIEDGKNLVDELADFINIKKKAELKIEELRSKILRFSIENSTNSLFGDKFNCFIKEFEKISIPLENKEKLIALIKQKGLYEDLSNLNIFKLRSRALKGNLDEDITSLTKKEKDYRLNLVRR